MSLSWIVVTFSIFISPVHMLPDEKRLIKHMLDNYDKVGLIGRPVLNTSDTVNVSHGLALIQIMDLDEKNQVLTTNCWNRYMWNDVLLKWDPADFGGLTSIRVPRDKIWTPDIVLFNYADDRLEEHRRALAHVFSDGTVILSTQAIFKSSCSLDITHFPFDKQRCSLVFGSWTYDGLKMDVNFYEAIESIVLSYYVESNEWQIIENSASKNTNYYPCCVEPYPDLKFSLVLQRVPAFYNYILLLPCVLLSTLTLLLFWLPPESVDRISLGMNIFVAFFVLLLLLSDSMPPAGSSIPQIGVFFCLNMMLITLANFLSVLVINIYFRGDMHGPVPKWLKVVFISVFGRILCKPQPKEDAVANSNHLIKINDSDANQQTYLMPDKTENLDASFLQNVDSSRFNNTHKLGGDDLQLNLLISLEQKVDRMQECMRQSLTRMNKKEGESRIAHEWKVIALVLDRIFFILYLASIVILLATMIPKSV